MPMELRRRFRKCSRGRERLLILRKQRNVRWLIAITRKPPVLHLQLDNLNRTASLLVLVFRRTRSPARMREVKQERAITAHDHIAMSANIHVVFIFAGLRQEIH